jgi:hypothetical protein
VDWPDLTVRWSRTNLGPLTLLSLAGNVRDREVRSTVPSFDISEPPSIDETTTRSFRPDIQLLFRNGVSVTGSFESSGGGRLTGGRRTTRDQLTWNANLQWSVRLPGSVSGLRKPLTTSLQANGFSTSECLEVDGGAACEIISDIRRTGASLTLGTDVVGSVRGELAAAYVVNELRHLDRMTSTLTLSLVLTVPLSTLGGM